MSIPPMRTFIKMRRKTPAFRHGDISRSTVGHTGSHARGDYVRPACGRRSVNRESPGFIRGECQGREYGSGFCYLCERCGAYVGTHKPRPWEALGLLADEQMRTGEKMCHALFDPLWQGKPKVHKKRNDLYRWLAREMGIPVEDCHFGYFDIDQLRRAYIILRGIQGQQMKYDNCGRIYFEETAHVRGN